MTASRMTAAVLLAMTTSSCATQADLRQLDKRFDAGWRPGKGYCLFGGETPKLDAYCARLNFGFEGELIALNAHVMEALPSDASCQAHARAVLAALRDAPELKGEPIYSCPNGYDGATPCHVSVLVTDPTGRKWVLDNRAVVTDTAGAEGVTRLAGFSALVRKQYWVGRPPSGLDAMFGTLAPAAPDLR